MSNPKTTDAGGDHEQADMENPIVPVVELPPQGPSNLLILSGAIVLGILVFFSLGRGSHESSGRMPPSTTSVQETIPPLRAPQQAEPVERPASSAMPEIAGAPPPVAAVIPQPVQDVPVTRNPPEPSNSRGNLTEPPLIIDLAPQGGQPSADTKATDGLGSDDVSATHIGNPSNTVVQGTLIKAVLETPIDSTRPGFARAVISRDVLSFDRKNIVVPRGTRAVGEYKSDATLGQKRALIIWHELILPNGTMIALDSPAADPLGGTGVAGKVDSHFFQRFGGAILQSLLTIGVNAASDSQNSSVVVALPGAVAQAGQSALPTVDVKPSIEVKEGALISIFVARNLNFPMVEAKP